jgi:DNA-binding transcriptional MocR family regulator
MRASEHGNGGNSLLYEELAATIGAMIESGTYRPGERIPSIREMSRQRRVSINTVLQGYGQLEIQGLIEARPQSGYYVCAPLPEPEGRTARPAPPKPVAASDVIVGERPLQIMRSLADPSLVPLGRATPNPEWLPADKLNRMLSTEARRLRAQGLSYAPVQGVKKLRMQIAKRSLAAGCSLSPEDIVVTSGCVEAVSLALHAVCRPGDTVAIAAPVYYTFLNSIQWLGLKVLEIPSTPREGMSIEVLRYALGKTPVHACIVIANFNNPLGCLMPEARKRELVKLLAGHDIPLIEDDVYGDLVFGPARPSSTKAYDEKGMVLYCSSFSKTLAPGYRIGWIVPGRFQKRVEHLKGLFNLATATPNQYAIAEFLANGGYDRYLRSIRKIYTGQIAAMRDAITHHFPPGTRVSRPAGSYILWAEMPEAVDALRLYEEALARGIGIAPGPLFTIGDGFRNCIRLNAAFWSDRTDHALETLGRIAHRMVENGLEKQPDRMEPFNASDPEPS